MSDILHTWDGTWGTTKFKYDGSVVDGTTIHYGKTPSSITVTSTDYQRMLSQFKGQTIPLGGIRNIDKRPPISLGKWIGDHVTKIAVASYIAPILVHEGYCKRVGDNIQF